MKLSDQTKYSNPHDLFYIAKFDSGGNVREGWDYIRYLEWWWADAPKTSTRNARTVSGRRSKATTRQENR